MRGIDINKTFEILNKACEISREDGFEFNDIISTPSTLAQTNNFSRFYQNTMAKLNELVNNQINRKIKSIGVSNGKFKSNQFQFK